jgi:phage replication-related protein YjqB (UPF0714/DUF867 family)
VLFADLLNQPGVDEVLELRNRFGLLAFHGGLEGGTIEVATAAADAAGASLYAVVQPSELRWHVPSHLVTAAASPALGRFLDHVEVAVAVHGYGRRDRPVDLLLGGRNRVLAAELAAHLRAHLPGYVVVDDLERVPRPMRGMHRDNPVNRPPGGGVQLELPPRVRGATAAVTDRGRPCTPHPGLVTALVATVAGYSTSKVPPARQ